MRHLCEVCTFLVVLVPRVTRAACSHACKLIDRPLLQLLHKVCVLECLRDVPSSRLPMC
jgi:hypothetical protein